MDDLTLNGDVDWKYQNDQARRRINGLQDRQAGSRAA